MTNSNPKDLPGLEPCPFCGGEGLVACRDGQSFVRCQEPDCMAEGPSFETDNEAASAWNTRADTLESLAAEGERLKGLVERFIEVEEMPFGTVGGTDFGQELTNLVRDARKALSGSA